MTVPPLRCASSEWNQAEAAVPLEFGQLPWNARVVNALASRDGLIRHIADEHQALGNVTVPGVIDKRLLR